MLILDYDYNQYRLKNQQILMYLEYRKLNAKRKEMVGKGFAVIFKDYEGMYAMQSIEDRGVMGIGEEHDEDKIQYIYDTLPTYPEGYALTMGFTKYRRIDLNAELGSIINTYNIHRKNVHEELCDQEDWNSMNKTEFKKFLKNAII